MKEKQLEKKFFEILKILATMSETEHFSAISHLAAYFSARHCAAFPESEINRELEGVADIFKDHTLQAAKKIIENKLLADNTNVVQFRRR